MANTQNLIPEAHKLTLEEQSAGGKASVKARKQRKTMRQAAELILSLKAPERIQDQMRAQGVPEDSDTYLDATVFATVGQAVKGNTRAFDMLMELMGEKVHKIEVTGVDDKSLKEMEDFLNGQSADL